MKCHNFCSNENQIIQYSPTPNSITKKTMRVLLPSTTLACNWDLKLVIVSKFSLFMENWEQGNFCHSVFMTHLERYPF
jgi:hypothetical protein